MFRRRTDRSFSDLLRRRDGATAVEFALIAVPFFWIMFAIAEIACISLVQTSLDAAVVETARTIRTGQAQAANQNAAAIKKAVCDYITKLMTVDCRSNLFIDVRRYTDFDDVAMPNPVRGGNVDPTRLAFQPGAASEVVLVRSYYNWQLLTPLFGDFFSNLTPGRRLVVSTAMFRNEPF
jgi:Flp pilus assembly protein TadG